MFRSVEIMALFAGLFAASAEAQPAKPNPNVIAAVEGNNQFAFDLYTRLANKPGNVFFSPYSVSNALGMTYAGARGQTADEMARTLHFTLPGAKLHPALGEVICQIQGDKKRPFELTTANRLWVQHGLQIRPDFLRITQEDYQSGLQTLDFIKAPEPSRLAINGWVERQTKDKIKDLVPESAINTVTRLVLTNAIYFKADWLSAFKKEATHPADFSVGGTEKVKVPTMNQALYPRYLDTKEFQLAEMGYKGGEVSMAIILPKKIDGLAEVEKKLSAASLAQDLAKAKVAHVAMSLPKFKMTQQFKLNEELASLGMPTAFSKSEANFAGMASNPGGNLYISSVIHKAFVEVDEKGTEAAAATAVSIAIYVSWAVEPMPIPFRADHPFLFVIRHNATGSILFMGRVNDPR